MKKPEDEERLAEPRAEYDFAGGSRGRYAERFGEGTTVVVLEPDVAREFHSSDAVNEALRWFLEQRERPTA
jgi:hypothetical protein